MISRWAQELLGYHFTVIHRPARMMRDVDGLTRRFGPLIAHHIMIASILAARDRLNRPSAYDSVAFTTNTKASMSEPLSPLNDKPCPILVQQFLDTIHAQRMPTLDSDQKSKSTKLLITTSPVMLVLATTVGITAQPPDSGNQEMRALDITASLDIHWL